MPLVDTGTTLCPSASSMALKRELDFNWSFKSLQCFVKILTGVDLLSSLRHLSKTSRWLKWFARGHVCLLFSVNVMVNIMWSIELIKMMIPLDVNETNEFLLALEKTSYNQLTKDIVEYLNSNVFYLGLQLNFLYITCWSSKWNDFWGHVIIIERECRFKQDLYYECRRVVLFVLFWMLTVRISPTFICNKCISISLPY